MAPPPTGNSLLHLAAIDGNVSEIRRLLGMGSDPEKRNLEGRTALELAEISGHTEAVGVIAAFLRGRP